jgi:hypothetical protein
MQMDNSIFDPRCHGFAKNKICHFQRPKLAFFSIPQPKFLSPSRFTSSTKVLTSITPRFRRIRQKSELLPIVFLSNLLLNIGTLQEKRRIHKNDQQQAASLSSHKLTSV